MIPKIIHQTYHNKNIPIEFQDSINNLKKINPTFSYLFYDDNDCENFISRHYNPNILSYYKKINPSYATARSDFFRYLLIYEMGGVYLDIKSTITLGLEGILENKNFILSHWNNAPGERFQGWGIHKKYAVPNEFQQWHIVACPKHPFLKAVIKRVMWNIDNYSPEVFGVGRLGTLNVTGPICYTKAIKPILHNHNHQLENVENLGFIYNTIGSKGNEDNHRTLMKSDYTKNKEPIILR